MTTVSIIGQLPSRLKAPIHESKVDRWIRDVDSQIQMLPPRDQNPDPADVRAEQEALAAHARTALELHAESAALRK